MRAHAVLAAFGLLTIAAVTNAAMYSTLVLLTPLESMNPMSGGVSGSGAVGVASVMADDVALTVSISTTFYGLATGNPPITQSHFHLAPIGSNGGVVIPVTNAGVGNFTVTTTADIIAAMLNGSVYYNVHTTSYGPGELRGQVRLHDSPGARFMQRLDEFSAASCSL